MSKNSNLIGIASKRDFLDELQQNHDVKELTLLRDNESIKENILNLIFCVTRPERAYDHYKKKRTYDVISSAIKLIEDMHAHCELLLDDRDWKSIRSIKTQVASLDENGCDLEVIRNAYLAMFRSTMMLIENSPFKPWEEDWDEYYT